MPCQRGSASADRRMRSAVCDTSVYRWREVPVPHGVGIAVRLMQTFGVVLGDGPHAQARCLEHWQRHVSGKADVAVRIELGDVDVPVGQRLEPYRAEEWLLRLDQQDRLREARIVEAAAEVHTRLDCTDLELIDRESRPRQAE